MNIIISEENGATIVGIVGRLDTVTSPELDKEVKPLIKLGATVVFDCAKMDYVSSSGLRVVFYVGFSNSRKMSVLTIS